jgi:hypothetical protein
VILATNLNIEGETTAMYLARLIKPFNIKVTRIAKESRPVLIWNTQTRRPWRMPSKEKNPD